MASHNLQNIDARGSATTHVLRNQYNITTTNINHTAAPIGEWMPVGAHSLIGETSSWGTGTHLDFQQSDEEVVEGERRADIFGNDVYLGWWLC
jgi:hypothetical protein